jgi:hypothetical protein
MRSKKSWLGRIFIIFIFAVAFGYFEAIVVVYLRQAANLKTLAGYPPVSKDQVILSLGAAISFLKKDALSAIFNQRFMVIEQIREAATIIMLATFGWLTGRDWKERTAVFFFSFGVWDIFYYVFLYLIIGWPKSLFAQDIYFLIPVPWIGPVITPVITSTFIIGFSVLFFYRSSSGRRYR